MGLNLGPGVAFGSIYRPSRRILVGDGVRNDLDNVRFDPLTVRLYRYVAERWPAVTPDSFWSELETEEPSIASEATGIPPGDCIWRAEWVFPTDNAVSCVSIGNVRMCAVGAFREYQNKLEIDSETLVWLRMNPSKSS